MVEVYMPPVGTNASYIQKHHQAYREIVQLGDCRITSNANKLTYVVSEREAWRDLPKLDNVPLYLCDKSKNKYYFAEVGMSTLETYPFTDLTLLKKFADKPCIIKPFSSAGSTTSTKGVYTIFNDARDLIEQHNDVKLWKNVTAASNMIIQRSVARAGVPYGQLHVECIVNGQGVPYFSSQHEVEFVNGLWTKQLNDNPADDQQRNAIKQQLSDLVALHGIKNCMFSLQFVRSFDDRVWYPTDWQYRLTYNTVWGRRVYEPQHVGNLVKYMTNQIGSIPTTSKLQYYQKMVNVNTQSKDQLTDMMQQHNIQYIPIQRGADVDPRSFLFISAGDTFEQAQDNMNQFEGSV